MIAKQGQSFAAKSAQAKQMNKKFETIVASP